MLAMLTVYAWLAPAWTSKSLVLLAVTKAVPASIVAPASTAASALELACP